MSRISQLNLVELKLCLAKVCITINNVRILLFMSPIRNLAQVKVSPVQPLHLINWNNWLYSIVSKLHPSSHFPLSDISYSTNKSKGLKPSNDQIIQIILFYAE